MEASIKKWCVGSPIQAALDGAVAVLEQGLDVNTIESIDLILPDDRLAIVDDREMPNICAQHMVAVCLLDGRVTFRTCHDKARMSDAAVLALREKMTIIPSSDLTVARPRPPGHPGSTHAGRQSVPPSHQGRPRDPGKPDVA